MGKKKFCLDNHKFLNVNFISENVSILGRKKIVTECIIKKKTKNTISKKKKNVNLSEHFFRRKKFVLTFTSRKKITK